MPDTPQPPRQPSTGQPSSAQPSTGQPSPRRLFAVAIVSFILTLSYGFADHAPAPHGVRIAVAAPAGFEQGLAAGLAHAVPGGFTVVAAPSARAVIDSVHSQSAAGGLVAGATGPVTIVTAGAAGASQQQAITAALTAAATAFHRQARPLDVAPLPASDRAGLSAFVFELGLLIPSVLGSIGLFLLGRRFRLWWRVTAAVTFSVLAACGSVLALDAVFGALTSATGALIGVGFFGSFTFVAFATACQAVTGVQGTGLAALVFVFVGNAVSGGTVSFAFLPDGFRQVAPWLPNGAIVSAARDVVYLPGSDLLHPLLVLGIWLAASLAVLASVDLLHLSERRRAPEREAALLVSHHRPGFYMRVITEGHIQAGDAIVKTRTGPGGLSVADTDALLYLPGHDPAKLRVALQIPALSPGWQGSFRDLLSAADDDGTTPSAGASPSLSAGTAWPGFRKLRVDRVVREDEQVCSIYLTAADGTALPVVPAGQYVTLRISGAGQPAPVRSYSLSSAPDGGTYRISVKQEPHGVASSYLNRDLRPGGVLDVAAPRGGFVLDGGAGPVLLISAGIGVTPVLSMLHQLAAGHSQRDIWWLYGARGPREHPFAPEAHTLLAMLPNAREHVFYSAATPAERQGAHAASGRLTKEALAGLAIPPSASAYVCGPASFMADMRDALTAIGLGQAGRSTPSCSGHCRPSLRASSGR
jgi:ferredoxin-NADP reductase